MVMVWGKWRDGKVKPFKSQPGIENRKTERLVYDKIPLLLKDSIKSG